MDLAKKLFTHKNLFSKKKVKLLIDSRRGWYEREIFRELVEREKHRSDRSGLVLSYVLLDLSRFSTNGTPFTKKDYLMFGEGILDTISKFTRLEDMKCLCGDSEIGILLVDTKRDGAELFVEKLAAKLLDHFDVSMKSHIINFIHTIKIYTSPLQATLAIAEGAGKTLESNPASTLNFSRSRDDQSHEMIMSRIDLPSERPFRLNIHAIGHGVMTLQESYLWYFSLVDVRERLLLWIKRVVDISGALFGLLVFLPVMAVVAVAVKSTSRGPVLFKQKRVGLAGREFNFYKFRSMKVDSDDAIHQEYVRKLIEGQNEEVNLGDDQKPCYKIKKDPRITKFGHFLRNTSLDELPQLINVLKGEMSLVGPRPPIPYEVKHYKSWHLQRVFKAKPGITGLWQLYGRSVCTFDDMVRYDLQYIEQFTPWLDIKIIFKTLLVFLRQNGAL